MHDYRAIELRINTSFGLREACVVLAADGKDDWGNMRLPQYTPKPELTSKEGIGYAYWQC